MNETPTTKKPASWTLRRDKLRREVEAGNIVVVGSYHFDDMLGQSRDTAKDMPAAIMPDDWHDRKEGICYLFPSDFDSGCGRAVETSTGFITLYVHSNSNYTFRRVAKPATEAQPDQGGTAGTVRRNIEHNGVEVSFPAKPGREVIDRLKANGFRWSMRSKVWYKKFSDGAWSVACLIAGVTDQDASHGADCAMRAHGAAECTCGKADALTAAEDDGAAGYVQAQEEAFCDRQAEAIGA